MKRIAGLMVLSAIMGSSMSDQLRDSDERGRAEGSLRATDAEVRTASGNKVEFTYAVMTALRDRLAAGEKADVLVMPVPVLDGLAKDGKVRADSAGPFFGTVGISAVVKNRCSQARHVHPEKLKQAILAASAVVHATPGETPSGTHMAKMIEQLGIADAMRARR